MFVALSVVCVAMLDWWVDAALFLEHGILFIAFVALFAVWAGVSSYYEFVPAHHSSHAGAAALVWGGGVAILGVIAWLVALLSAASTCLDVKALISDPVSVPFAADAQTLALSADAGERCEHVRAVRMYALLTPWQTGIGAAIGLLGVAWSAMYRSVYEDWKRHAPPTSEEWRARAPDRD